MEAILSFIGALRHGRLRWISGNVFPQVARVQHNGAGKFDRKTTAANVRDEEPRVMGRRSAPKATFSLRKAIRFGHIEAAVLLGSLLIAIVAGVVGSTRQRATDQLAGSGACRDARVVEASGSNSLRLGRSATLSYSDGQRGYLERLHYDGSNRLDPGDTVTICIDPDEPTTFAALFNGSSGTSTNLWLRSIVGLAMSAAAFVAFVVTMSTHQWRFEEDED